MLNWPFIRRAPAEQRIADLSRELVACRATIAAVVDNQVTISNLYASLLEKYHALRVEGANPAPPIIPAAPRPEPDPVAQAMVEMAKGSPVLMKQFRDFVNEQRAGGALEAEIAEKLRRGESDDEGVP